jgi:hypothetical protein
MPKKYDHIDFKPPKGAAEQAERGLRLREQATSSNKGGLSVSQAKKEGVGSGVQRAVNLKNRNTLSPETIKKMHGFFSRHEKNKKIDKGKTPLTDKGYQAWLLWGGDPGAAWARKLMRQMQAVDKKASYAVDKVASVLEQKGLHKYALALDKLADRLDGDY